MPAPPSVPPAQATKHEPRDYRELFSAIGIVAVKAAVAFAVIVAAVIFVGPLVLGRNRGIATGTYRDSAGVSAYVIRRDGTYTMVSNINCSPTRGTYRVADNRIQFDFGGTNDKMANHPMTSIFQSALAGEISNSKDAFSIMGMPYTRVSADTGDSPMPCTSH